VETQVLSGTQPSADLSGVFAIRPKRVSLKATNFQGQGQSWRSFNVFVSSSNKEK